MWRSTGHKSSVAPAAGRRTTGMNGKKRTMRAACSASTLARRRACRSAPPAVFLDWMRISDDGVYSSSSSSPPAVGVSSFNCATGAARASGLSRAASALGGVIRWGALTSQQPRTKHAEWGADAGQPASSTYLLDARSPHPPCSLLPSRHRSRRVHDLDTGSARTRLLPWCPIRRRVRRLRRHCAGPAAHGAVQRR
jgi:hypothetical protein